MFKRILLPLDGSQLAERVLPHAVRCAQATQGCLTIAHVLPTSDVYIDIPSVDPLDWRLRKMEANLYLEEIANLLAARGITVETVLLQGEAAESITQYARSQAVDLIVMSSHGRSGINGWNAGSVVQKVALTTHTSIMLIPAYRSADAASQDLRYRTIVAPLDGSQRAESVLPLLRTLGQRNQAGVQFVTVVPRPEMPRRAPLSPADETLVEQIMARHCAEAEKYLTQLGSRAQGNVSEHVLLGDDVFGTLHDFIRQQEADLVVLSAHGHSANGTRRYGSLATSFIAYGSTPLVIVQDLAPDEIMKSEAEAAAEALFAGPMKVWTVVNAPSSGASY